VRLGPRPSIVACLQPPLARDKVRYVGEPVAFVVAESRYLAEDALEAMEVDYDPLPTVADARRAVEGDAPVLHEVIHSNVVATLDTHKGDASSAMAQAHVRVRERFAVQRHTGVPLETRGLTAAFEPGTGLLRLWGVAKVPHFNRRVLADLLPYPEHLIQFVELEVGGGFGVRGEFYPEDFVIPWAAMRLGRPIQWIEDRREHLMAANHSRQQLNFIEPDEMPYEVGGASLGQHVVFDCGDYKSAFETALAALDYKAARAEQIAKRREGRYLGIGIGALVEKAGLGPWEYARVEVDA